jgi:hypothetical protein
MKRSGIITEACIEKLRKNGHETIELSDGSSITLAYKKEIPQSATAHGVLVGDGFYIEENR